MDHFSVELWMNVFQNVRTDNLLALSTTCRHFCKIAKEKLYRSIELPAMRHKKDVRFARSIAEDPRLGGLVRTFTCTRSSPIFDRDSPTLRQMSLFSHLHTIEFDRVPVNAQLLYAIQRLPRLESITYQSCKLAGDLQSTQSWEANLSAVAIRAPSSKDNWVTMIPPTIRSLKLEEYRAGSSHWSQFINQTLSGLLLQPQFLQLTALSIEGFARNIVDFIISCPQLRKLSLTGSKDHFFLFNSFPSHALPLLEEFCGDSRIAEVFISGRPIHSADISLTTTSSINALTFLRHSLVPLKKLRLRSEGCRLFPDVPTTLHELELTDWDMDEKFPSALSGLQNLKTLKLSPSGLDLPELPLKFVHAASEMIPSLRAILVDPSWLVISVRFYWTKDGPWECYKDGGSDDDDDD